MKKTLSVLFLLLFLFCLNFGFCQTKTNVFVYAKFSTESSSTKYNYEINYNQKIFRFLEDDFLDKNTLSNYQQTMRSADVFNNINKLLNMGFSKQEAITYIFPETSQIFAKLKKAIEKEPKQEDIFVDKNNCKLIFNQAKTGIYINQEDFYNDLYNQFSSDNKNIKIDIKTKDYNLPKIEKSDYLEKSCFSTNFNTSNNERKNNIKVALGCFDGLVLEDGEVLSFNATTGARNEKAGYKKAKIISGGTFVEGFGGGVCQVSTTLYNACLLAGLEILEVHNHSLPVSYIEPSFDAMVNTGSSDLVVRNNSGGRLIFTTSSKNDICKVKIFGKANKYKITRFSEKTKIIPAETEEVITDPKKADEYGLIFGQEKRISYAKDGFSSNGYLNYYDKFGNLIKTTKIRSNTYNPTKGIVIKREEQVNYL